MIVEAHGGRLAAESEDGLTTFQAVLPRAIIPAFPEPPTKSAEFGRP